jgi:hypothetical protein
MAKRGIRALARLPRFNRALMEPRGPFRDFPFGKASASALGDRGGLASLAEA